MMLDDRTRFGSYLTDLLSKGQVVFSDAQAQMALDISRGAFLAAAEKQQKRGHLIKPRRGFYVIVPPQFHSWGAPPPHWYIDALMLHEERPYYVALLKAAELQGASHQAVMEFQVVTDRQLPQIRAGRSRIAFYYRKDIAAVRHGLTQHKTDTGSMLISGPELTALDLLRYPHAGGGLDHILTVLVDLGAQIDAQKLATLAGEFERSVLQRLGYLLVLAGYEEIAVPLRERLFVDRHVSWIELEPQLCADKDLMPEIVERDARWRVKVRRIPEADT